MKYLITGGMGVNGAVENKNRVESAAKDLAIIAGQRPTVRKAKKAISNFKIRKGQAIGCMVTLRGSRMYEFFERLVRFALPRIRDFRGVPVTSFDGRGNYTFGIAERPTTPEEFLRLYRTEGQQWIAIARELGITLD